MNLPVMSPPIEPRRPVVGVMGSGSEEHEYVARPFGQWLAQQGVHLLTGAGLGVMTSVSRAFFETPGRSGLVIGIVPSVDRHYPNVPRPGYPNPWVELPIQTHLYLSGEQGTETASRNPINILTSDVVVALPGGAGTRSEVELAIAYDRPVVVYTGSPSDPEALWPKGLRKASTLEALQEFVTEQLAVLRPNTP